jgi:hypothetical protein
MSKDRTPANPSQNEFQRIQLRTGIVHEMK